MTIPLMVGRTLAVLLMLSPAAACAKPVDRAPSPIRETATSAAGVPLQDFIKRRENRLLAKDTDGDGKVSKAEFLSAAKAGKGDPAKRFAKIDRNGDGMLDKSEIDAMLVRRFKRLDANSDGAIRAEERTARKNINATGDETDS